MQYFGFDRPSFLSSFFGFFESSPKLQADFTTGEYKASGVTKTFAEVFTFNRAGKAWLVKDTGLVEYASDVPRFDNGLLIEQAATNLALDSAATTASAYPVKGGPYTVANDTLLNVGNMYTLLPNSYTYKRLPLDNNNYYVSYYLSKTNNSLDIVVTYGASGDASNSGSLGLATKAITSSLVRCEGSVSDLGSNRGMVRYPEQSTRLGDIRVHAMQLESGNRLSSFIVTNTVPVTRPADFLQTKVSGTTITGDWDSTLNLSISNGQIVHSGYGRIRSLEIN